MNSKKYTKEDLENIIAICEQEDTKAGKSLVNRCKKALAYRDVDVRLTKKDKEFLKQFYDKDMDAYALETLKKVLELE